MRLEDACAAGHWLFGHDLTWEGAGTEEMVPLTQPVPVYITYLTAMPEGRRSLISTTSMGATRPRLATPQSAAGTVASASR